MAFAEAGAAVTYASRTGSELRQTVGAITAEGGQAQAVECDVAEPDTERRLLRDAEAWAGPVDLLVKNAAVAGPLAWFGDSDLDDPSELRLRPFHRRGCRRTSFQRPP